MMRFFLPRTWERRQPVARVLPGRGSLAYALKEIQEVSSSLVPDLVAVKNRLRSHDGLPTQA